MDHQNKCTDAEPTAKKKDNSPIKRIIRIKKARARRRKTIRTSVENYDSVLVNLAVATGYLTKLLTNETIKNYIARHQRS